MVMEGDARTKSQGTAVGIGGYPPHNINEPFHIVSLKSGWSMPKFQFPRCPADS